MPESLGPIKWGGADPAVASAKETFRATKTFRLSDDDRVVQRVSKLPPLSKSETKVAEAKPLRKTATVQAAEPASEFKPDTTALNAMSLATLDHVASLVSGGHQVNLTISTRDTKKVTDPALIEKRIGVVVDALAMRGIAKNEAKLKWRPSAEQMLMSSTSGIQEIARMRVG